MKVKAEERQILSLNSPKFVLQIGAQLSCYSHPQFCTP